MTQRVKRVAHECEPVSFQTAPELRSKLRSRLRIIQGKAGGLVAHSCAVTFKRPDEQRVTSSTNWFFPVLAPRTLPRDGRHVRVAKVDDSLPVNELLAVTPPQHRRVKQELRSVGDRFQLVKTT
jgi:hypothetical protein